MGKTVQRSVSQGMMPVGITHVIQVVVLFA